jgi:hypothetical protein
VYSLSKPPGRPRKRCIENATCQQSGTGQTGTENTTGRSGGIFGGTQNVPFLTPSSIPVNSYGRPPSPVLFEDFLGQDTLNGFDGYMPQSDQMATKLTVTCCSPPLPSISRPLPPNGILVDIPFDYTTFVSVPPFGSAKPNGLSWSPNVPSKEAHLSFPPSCGMSAGAPIQPCTHLPSFFSAISSLRDPPGPFTFPQSLTTLRDTLSIVTTSVGCRYCHASVQSTYICMMMLGTLVPLLLLYIESAFHALSSAQASRSVVVCPGVEVELSEQQWRGMAYGALHCEFSTLMGVVNELGGVLERRYGSSGDGMPARAYVGQELVDKWGHKVSPQFCINLLSMVRNTADRIQETIKPPSQW